MKVLLYSGAQKMIEKSGVGRAIYHQMEALDANQVEYTTDMREDWDVAHINTIFPQILPAGPAGSSSRVRKWSTTVTLPRRISVIPLSVPIWWLLCSKSG